MIEAIQHCLATIRISKPLIHNITNAVAMAFSANALLAVGASPIMAHAVQEMADLVTISQALVINIGTLDAEIVLSMRHAMQAAAKIDIPIVLDPVGVGASAYRRDTVLALINNISPTIIRGNAAEIIALLDPSQAKSQGVDSLLPSDAACACARLLSAEYNCVVVVSGATDFVIHHDRLVCIDNGVPMMQCVTATGCVATTMIAASIAVTKDALLAACCGMVINGIAGEIAAKSSIGPGSFQVAFLDALATLSAQDIAQFCRLRFEY